MNTYFHIDDLPADLKDDSTHIVRVVRSFELSTPNGRELHVQLQYVPPALADRYPDPAPAGTVLVETGRGETLKMAAPRAPLHPTEAPPLPRFPVTVVPGMRASIRPQIGQVITEQRHRDDQTWRHRRIIRVTDSYVVAESVEAGGRTSMIQRSTLRRYRVVKP